MVERKDRIIAGQTSRNLDRLLVYQCQWGDLISLVNNCKCLNNIIQRPSRNSLFAKMSVKYLFLSAFLVIYNVKGIDCHVNTAAHGCFLYSNYNQYWTPKVGSDAIVFGQYCLH